MSELPTMAQMQKAKDYCRRLYSHKPWFCGCVYRKTEDEWYMEMRTDPEFKDRYTYIGEHAGVRIRTVKWNESKHGPIKARDA